MRKVLLIIENIGSGGAERQMCGLAASLTEIGYNCRLISYEKRQFFEQYLLDHKVDYQFVPSLLNKRTRVPRLALYLWKYRPDVVISFNESVNMTACLTRLLYPCKVVVSERNNQYRMTRADKIRFFLYRLSDHIVPNSYSQGLFIVNNYPSLAKKICPIVNFVDLDKFKKVVYKQKSDRLRIIITARYTEQKNCLFFLDFVEKVKMLKLPVVFEWFGSFSANPVYFDNFIKKYESLDICDYLIIHDQTKNIVEEYNKSDVFCLPSLYEGYPNVIIEAMCCNLPIICSNVYENPYIVEEGLNGFLFNPNEVDSAIKALKNMLNLSAEEREKMGYRNRIKCQNINSIKEFTDRWIKIIES